MIADPKMPLLERVIASVTPHMSRELASAFIAMQFSPDDQKRMDELSTKARSVGLSEDEKADFHEFCVVGDILSLLHLRAHEVLDHAAGD